MSEKCYFCGGTEVLEQHHIVPRRHGGSNREENLVTLCPTCHRKIEKLYNKRFYTTLGVDNDGPGGLKFVQEMVEVDFPFHPSSAAEQQQRDLHTILSHFGADADRYLCNSCGRPTVYIDSGDGVAQCVRCNMATGEEADYTSEQAAELFGEEYAETDDAIWLTIDKQLDLIKSIKAAIREYADDDDRFAGAPIEKVIESVDMNLPDRYIGNEIDKLRGKGEIYSVDSDPLTLRVT